MSRNLVSFHRGLALRDQLRFKLDDARAALGLAARELGPLADRERDVGVGRAAAELDALEVRAPDERDLEHADGRVEWHAGQ